MNDVFEYLKKFQEDFPFIPIKLEDGQIDLMNGEVTIDIDEVLRPTIHNPKRSVPAFCVHQWYLKGDNIDANEILLDDNIDKIVVEALTTAIKVYLQRKVVKKQEEELAIYLNGKRTKHDTQKSGGL